MAIKEVRAFCKFYFRAICMRRDSRSKVYLFWSRDWIEVAR